MGLFDVFTGAPAKDAADANKALLAQTQTGIADRTQATKNLAGNFLNTGFDQALGNLGLGYDAAGNAIKTGATGAINYLDAGTTGALDQFGRARADLAGASNGYGTLADLAGNFRQGSNLYADAMGVNGPGGNTRATGAFQAGPGYQFTLDQGLGAVNRAANARGALNSGNTDVDALKFGTGLANNTYQQWVQNLSPYNNLSLSATQGAAAGNADIGKTLANLDQNQAGLLTGVAANKAGIASNQGTSLADLARAYYGGAANLNTSRGSALAGNETGANSLITNSDLAITPAIAKQNTDAANAQMAGSGNLWNLGIQLAKLGTGAVGGAGGWGSLFGGGGGSAGAAAV
jgi:hypothetical protein